MGINKQTIMDNYAKEQGYDDWDNLYLDICVKKYSDTYKLVLLENHYNKVMDLIQDELKKKIANEQDLEGIQHIILNTENL